MHICRPIPVSGVKSRLQSGRRSAGRRLGPVGPGPLDKTLEESDDLMARSRKRKIPSTTRRTIARKAVRPGAAAAVHAPTQPAFGTLRAALDLTRAQFSRLLGYSERALAEWESGSRHPTAPAVRSHRELERLIAALQAVMKPSYVRTWLMTPAEAFDGLKPLEVIERGETDRIWRMVFELQSGSSV
jgi:DNA-binding transcriptional regulator YiaG